jgi:hypothetical protein
MGKQAKKKAEELQIRNAYLKSVQNEGQNEEPAIVDNRPSLMEEHLAKKSRVEDNGPKVRRPFDREKVSLALAPEYLVLTFFFSFSELLRAGCSRAQKVRN